MKNPVFFFFFLTLALAILAGLTVYLFIHLNWSLLWHKSLLSESANRWWLEDLGIYKDYIEPGFFFFLIKFLNMFGMQV